MALERALLSAKSQMCCVFSDRFRNKGAMVHNVDQHGEMVGRWWRRESVGSGDMVVGRQQGDSVPLLRQHGDCQTMFFRSLENISSKEKLCNER